ncbi:chemotaxis protein CheD [Pseudodesulfovibrio sediminis]|nr:chemotaxis protein CheD [Pseudodesulfovibrio sediminis]
MDNLIVVGISDMKISTDPDKILVTYSLGSCVGVTAYDPQAQVGGLIHCLLSRPGSVVLHEGESPYKFVSAGVPRMVKELLRAGADRDRLIFKAAGGADMRGDGAFDIGQKNIDELLELMDRSQVKLAASELGGVIPRTMFLHLDTGRVVIKTCGVSHDL